MKCAPARAREAHALDLAEAVLDAGMASAARVLRGDPGARGRRRRTVGQGRQRAGGHERDPEPLQAGAARHPRPVGGADGQAVEPVAHDHSPS